MYSTYIKNNSTTFKTWLNDLRDVQGVVNELKNIDAWVNGATNLLSDTSVKKMSTAISGLNKEQALLALSTKKLTDEQKIQILTEAKLLETTTELTTGQLQERIAKQLSSKEDAKALLIKSGLVTQQELEKNSTITVTKAKLQEILANKKLSASDKEVILSSLGVANANNKEALSFGLIGKSIKNKISSIGTFIKGLSTLTKVGLGAVGVITALGGIFIYFTQNVERAKKKLEESADAYKEVKSEVENLNSELQTTQTRIDELNAKQNLTLVESEELDKLKETNEELERELRIRKAIALEKGKEANKDAVKYFNAESTYGTSAGIIDVSGDQLEILDFQLDKIKELEEYFKNTDPNNKDFLYIQNEKLLSFLKEETAKTVEEFMEFDDNLLEGYDEGLLSRLEVVYQKYDEVANGVAQAHSNTIAGILEKVDFASDKIQLLELGKDGSLSVDMLSAKFPELIQYLQEAGVSAQELYQYIMALSNPNAINYDEVRKQLMESAGIRDGQVNGASDAKVYDTLQSSGVLSNEGLEAYLTVKSKFTDGETEFWSVDDWIYHIQNELKQTDFPDEITVSNIFELEDADGKLTTLGTLNDQVENIQKAYTGLKSAMDSYNESGHFTLDQVQEILTYGDGYLQYLMDENGNLQLNEEALNKLMVARINEMRVKALSDLYNQVASIKDEEDALKFLEDRLTDVTEATNEYNEAKFQSLLLSKRELMSDEAYAKFESSVIKMVNTTNALFDNIDVGSFSGKGSDDLAKAAKETLESTLAVHKAELDAGIIDLDTYLKKCNDLLNDARDKAIITSAEYWDYQKEVLENQKNVYDKALSAINRRYDKEIDSIEKVIDALEKQNETLEKQLAKYDSAISAITKFLDTQKDLLQDNIDGIEAENDAIQNEIDGYDQLLSAVTHVIDAKREAVEADKQAIQDRIDALREENDEAKRAYELEQARFELERLRNSRTKKLYVQGQGYIFDVDHSAIREQEDSVADLELDATTSALEKEQELLDNILEQLDTTEQKWQDIADVFENNKALEKAKELLGDNFKNIILEGDNKSINDILNAYIGAQGKLEDNTLIIEDYEKRMEQLDAIAKKWENVANIKEETENAINAAELLGKEWQEIILADRAENYEEFCAKYLEIQSKIDDNTSMIESYEEKVEYYENLKQQWSDIADAYKYAEEDMYLTQVLGSNAEADLLNGRLDTLENFKVQYMAIEQAIVDAAWNSANEQNKALASIGSGSTDGKGDISGGSSLSEPTQEEIIIIKKTSSNPSKKNMVAQVFHDGIKKGYPDASVPKDKKLETLQKLATEEIPLKNDELPIIARNDELLINEPQQLMLMENYQKLMESMSAIPWNVSVVNTNPLANVGMIKREQPISISIGDIHLHEVQNVDSFADAIVRQLPNKVLQAVHRR